MAKATVSVDETKPDHVISKRGEFEVILFMAFIVAPAIIVGFVASYGFVVWMLQLFVGPPTS